MPNQRPEPHDSVINLGTVSEHQAGGQRTPPYPRKSSSPTAYQSPEDAAAAAATSAAAFVQAETTIIALGDDSSEGDDGGYGSGSDADTVSLASTARNFIYENGRRYHSYRAGAYSFPNDDREQDREDLKHAMYLKLFNGILHFAPIDGEKDINVIDLGTGTGIWAIDFADMYPNSNILGIDLSPIQTDWVPPNLKFMVDDAEDEWLHPPNYFDYVHTRHTVQAFRNWPKLMERALRHLKPGGWMEMQEIEHYPRSDDGTLAADDGMCQYWGNVTQGLANIGLDFRIAPKLSRIMREAGFVNVTERIFWVPVGPWPKNKQLREVGLYWRAVLMEGLQAIALGPMTRGLGWQKEEIEVFIASVRKAYLEKSTHSFMPFHIIYGQKPMNGH